MKKIYTSLVALGLAVSVNAQNRQAATHTFTPYSGGIKEIVNTEKAPGDTLFWCPLDLYFINPADQPTFQLLMEDVDGHTLSSSLPPGLSQSFGVFFSTDAQNIFPNQGDVDTGFFFYAVSWFDPVGQASNWLTFGPITIPAGGADISWMHRIPDDGFRDGYRVLVNPFGIDDLDFTEAPIFTRTDNQPGFSSDTNWTQVTASVPWNYSGQQLFFAFHHNANDMFFLYLDDIRVTEGSGTASLENNAQVTLLSAYPNPFRINTNIAFDLKNASEVMFHMYDLSGKMVMQRHTGTMNSGLNQIEIDGTALPAGVYYYTLTINGETTSAHKIVKM